MLSLSHLRGKWVKKATCKSPLFVTLCECVCVCIAIYTYTHIHTHTHYTYIHTHTIFIPFYAHLPLINPSLNPPSTINLILTFHNHKTHKPHQSHNTVTQLTSTIRTIFIQTSETPNPSSLKFLPGRPVYPTSDDRGFFVQPRDISSVKRSPLAASLLRSCDEIEGIYIGSDFVTVTKGGDAKWEDVRTKVFECLMDHFADKDAVAVIEDDDTEEEEVRQGGGC